MLLEKSFDKKIQLHLAQKKPRYQRPLNAAESQGEIESKIRESLRRPPISWFSIPRAS